MADGWLWVKEMLRRPQLLQVPVTAFLIVSAFSLAAGYGLQQNRRSEIERETALAAASAANELSSQVSARVLALVRMAWRREVMGSPRAEEWETDVQLYLREFSGLQGIAWITSAGEIQLSVSRDGQAWGSSLSEPQSAVLQQAREHGAPRATTTFLLPTGERGFLVFVPVGGSKKPQGCLVGVYRVPELLKDTLHENIVPDYEIAILEGQDSIYRRGTANQALQGPWVQEKEVRLYGKEWRVRVWPEPGILAKRRTFLPELVPIAGMLMGLLFGIALYFNKEAQLRSQEAQQRAEEAEAAHRQLKSEMVSRKLAEEGFRQQAQILAQLEEALLSTDLHGYVTSWNRGARRLLGFQAEEVLGKYLPFLSKSESPELFARELLIPLQAKGRYETTLRLAHKSGSEITARVLLSVLRDDSGDDTGVIFSVHAYETPSS